MQHGVRLTTSMAFVWYVLGLVVLLVLWGWGAENALAATNSRGVASYSLDASIRDSIPAELMPWVPWVLKEHPDWSCPFNTERPQVRQCLWPTRLQMTREGERFLFDQYWVTYTEGWLSMPGGLLNDESQNWPLDVSINGKPAVVVQHKKRPAVFVPPGQYHISGQLPVAGGQPFVRIPPGTALISLVHEGRVLIDPKVDEQGRLWLTPPKRSTPENENALSYQLFRRFVDGVPVTVTSRIQLDVVSSSTLLPIQWDGNDLVVRVKPGQWVVEVQTRFSTPVTRVLVPERSTVSSSSASNSPSTLAPIVTSSAESTRESETAVNHTVDETANGEDVAVYDPDREIWVLETNSQFRSIVTEGLVSIDPAQTALPHDWQALRAFLPKPGATWTWSVPPLDSPVGRNKLTLHRRAWLDFSGKGFTVADALTGTVGEQWRLSIADGIQLGQVSVNDVPAVIGRVSHESGLIDQGVELRSPDLSLQAVGRLEGRASELPVSAWSSPLESVVWDLHLPAAWRVAAVRGVDRVTGVWWSKWRLWDVFWVALLVVGVRRL
ncbi:MAG: hypothetical protein P8104_13265, partial [Gammaproteobacteria bacterium]